MRGYRILLRLYPASFRAEYGAELERLHRERLQAASGRAERRAVLREDLLDVLRNAGPGHWDLLRQDLRQSVRSLRRGAGFALPAILLTAVGIGANTAVFSVADRVLLRPLPFTDAERLVALWESVPAYSHLEPSPANFTDWRGAGGGFEELAAYATATYNLVGTGEPQQWDGAVVTAELLPLLGARPALGRLFSPEDDRPGSPGTVLIGHRLWQRAFGGSPTALGTVVRLDDQPFTVIGVLPPGFAFPSPDVQLWTTLRIGPAELEDRDNNYLKVVGKLAPAVSLAEARAAMDVVAARLEEQHSETNTDTGIRVVPLRDQVPSSSRTLLAGLFGASLCVLLISCTNLANLLLVRSLGRQREIAVRAALGAGGERLVRQLLTESLLLASLGGGLGLILASLAVPLLDALVPNDLPLAAAPALDARVLLFGALVTTLTGLGFGVLPALRAARRRDLGALRDGRSGGFDQGQRRLRTTFVFAQVAATVVLVVTAANLIRALARVEAVDAGFRSENVLAIRTPLPFPRYAATQQRTGFYARVLDEVQRLPGVDRAAFVSFLPMEVRGGIWPVAIAGAVTADGEARPTASLRVVTPGFFETLGIPLRRGRDVRDDDTLETPMVAVVSQSFADRHWPGEEPLGKTFGFAFADRSVVGVVADIRMRGPERASEPQVYLPHRQIWDEALPWYAPRDLVLHASSDPLQLTAHVRQLIAAADPELPIADVRRLDDVVAAQTGSRRIQLRVLGIFAGLAIALAAIGLHGLLSFALAQRIPELAVRRALGAGAREMLRATLRDALFPAAAGGVVGAALAYGAQRAIRALLAGVPALDVTTLSVAALATALVAVAGCGSSAYRAWHVDPRSALAGG